MENSLDSFDNIKGLVRDKKNHDIHEVPVGDLQIKKTFFRKKNAVVGFENIGHVCRGHCTVNKCFL